MLLSSMTYSYTYSSTLLPRLPNYYQKLIVYACIVMCMCMGLDERIRLLLPSVHDDHGYRLGVPEQALGGIPLGFGIVVEDKPSDLPCINYYTLDYCSSFEVNEVSKNTQEEVINFR